MCPLLPPPGSAPASLASGLAASASLSSLPSLQQPPEGACEHLSQTPPPLCHSPPGLATPESKNRSPPAAHKALHDLPAPSLPDLSLSPLTYSVCLCCSCNGMCGPAPGSLHSLFPLPQRSTFLSSSSHDDQLLFLSLDIGCNATSSEKPFLAIWAKVLPREALPLGALFISLKEVSSLTETTSLPHLMTHSLLPSPPPPPATENRVGTVHICPYCTPAWDDSGTQRELNKYWSTGKMAERI